MTIRDVAEKAGVSYTTVSHVINGTRRVAEETAARVQSAIKELSFEPNAPARCLKKGRSGMVGVMNIACVDPYFAEVLSGIEEACRQTDHAMIVCHSDSSAALEAENISMLRSKGVDAIIINSLIGGEETFELLGKQKIPVLILQSVFPDGCLDCMHTDDRRGAHDAVAHLIGLGHQRIACATGYGMPHSSALLRLRGYREALLEAGLIVADDYVMLGGFSYEDGYRSAAELMRLDEPPTAIFLYSDIMAMGALRAIADAGLRSPEDVSVVGFDDLPVCDYSRPRLSSVRHSKAALGRAAFERVRARILDPSLRNECRALPAVLVPRESSGPAPGPERGKG